MRFPKLSKVGLFAVAISTLLSFQSAIAQVEDAQATPDGEENESQPARETPNFFSGENPSPPPSPTPAATPTEEQEPSDRGNFGIGKFARLPFHLSTSARAGYDDNLLTTGNQGQGSVFVGSNTELSYKFGDPRTDLSLKVGGGVTYYFDRSAAPTPTPFPLPFPTPPPPPPPTFQSYDVDVHLGLSLTHKLTQRLTLGADVNTSYQTQPNFSANAGTNRRSGNYLYSSDKLGATYQWLPRFVTETSYHLSVVQYDNSEIGASQDRVEQIFGNQISFAIWPTTQLFGEYRFGIVTYDQAPFDSTSQFFLGGFKHNFDPHFGVVVLGGLELRSFTTTGGNLSEPYFEGTLNYALGQRTTLGWTNHYSLEEPGVAGIQSRTTFRTGLQMTHKLAPRISANVAFYFVHDDYPAGPRPPRILPPPFPRPFGSPEFTEDSLDVTIGIRYELNRTFSIDIDYGRTELMSEFTFREYSRNRYFAGLNLTF